MVDEYYPKETTGRAAAREICDWVESGMVAVICVVLLFTFIARISDVDGVSMQPTLEHQDRLVITRLGLGPSQGDIVVVTLPGREDMPYVKRVIATGGQTIDINFETGQVFVDGQLLDEPYLREPTSRSADVSFPRTVPYGHVFILGDNRNNSRDSRNSCIGMVDERNILGRTVFRVWPFQRAGRP